MNNITAAANDLVWKQQNGKWFVQFELDFEPEQCEDSLLLLHFTRPEERIKAEEKLGLTK